MSVGRKRIEKVQRNELLIHTLNSKRKVCEEKKLRTMDDTHKLILYNNEIYVPQPFQERILNWYCHYLSHLGAMYLAKMYSNHMIGLG